MIWALNLTKIEAIKITNMPFSEPAILVAENINIGDFTNSMNKYGYNYKNYLQDLTNLFVGKAKSELAGTKFATVSQERNETIPLFASRLVSVFTGAFPNEYNPNRSIHVIDSFRVEFEMNNERSLYCNRNKNRMG